MYRLTRKAAQQREADRQRRAQETRQRNRLARPAPDYPAELPELRMRITVERFDFAAERHVVELHRTRRVDVYVVTIDGQPWKRCGLSGVLEGIRKACPRVSSPRHC
jgi:hypothetical protein